MTGKSPATKDEGVIVTLWRAFSVGLNFPPLQSSMGLPFADTDLITRPDVVGLVDDGFLT